MSTIAIRPAQITDLPAIRHIAQVTWRATYPNIASHNRRSFINRAYSDQQLLPVLSSPQDWFYVALERANIVAYAHFLQRAGPDVELVRLYILPQSQRQGVGTAMLQHGLAALAALGYQRCFVAVYVTNTAARQFYEKHGFQYHRSLGQVLGDQLLQLVEYKLFLNPPKPQTEIR